MMQKQKKTHNKYKICLIQQNHLLRFGKFGFKSLNYFRINKEVFELIYFMLLRKSKLINSKKKIKIWNKLNFNQNLTCLPQESRMGKGKGAIFTQSIFIKPGTIIFEFDNITLKNILSLFFYINKKLAVKISLIRI